ncbi:hypothetical protein L6164_005312 [Bauhinia variegata]|uniref:Uncharacterized protein n=1 Tax=Bauhinia variegata TaxID=167791 RepID=A0ACB9PQG7_BAUVA|nr:hypothetical protein L6164_005312 [Bauhinia variegata]
MRLSCNGCRVLRKGCTADCPIRPCLQWIKSSESQANATVFLAKFYGRAGLLNLVSAGPPHLRPAIFKSLLYEACGRIVNPIFGSAGLLTSGSWHLCQAAVEAVLRGVPIKQVSSDSALDGVSPLLKACDIRHVAKKGNSCAVDQLHKVKSRSKFKRKGEKPKSHVQVESVAELTVQSENELDGSVSHDSGLSEHWSQGGSVNGEADSSSVETVEALLGNGDRRNEDGSLDLELTLGWVH